MFGDVTRRLEVDVAKGRTIKREDMVGERAPHESSGMSAGGTRGWVNAPTRKQSDRLSTRGGLPASINNNTTFCNNQGPNNFKFS